MLTSHTIRTIEEALAYYTECHLATLEGLPKRTSKYERERLTSIAQGMVQSCRDFGIKEKLFSNPDPWGRRGLGRLERALSDEKGGT